MEARNSQALNSAFLIEITIRTELLILISLQLLLFFDNQNIVIWYYFVFFINATSPRLCCNEWGYLFFFFLDTIRFESSWIEFISVLIFTIWDPSVRGLVVFLCRQCLLFRLSYLQFCFFFYKFCCCSSILYNFYCCCCISLPFNFEITQFFFVLFFSDLSIALSNY